MASSFLNVQYVLLGYADTSATQAPKLKTADFGRNFQGQSVLGTNSQVFQVQPSATLSLFNGTRSITADSSTAWSLSLVTIAMSTFYRLTWTGGTNPTLRTDRALALSGEPVTVAVNTNGTVTFTIPGASSNTFAAVQVGDTVFIPGPVTGDSASVFNTLNQGFWVVLSQSTYSLTCIPPPGTLFQAVAEVQTPGSNTAFVAFSSTSGVQVGDNMDLSAGFSTPLIQTFGPLTAVTSTWVEFASTQALPLQTAITPGATGIVFYSQGKRLVFLECDQQAAVQANGDTGQTQRLSPILGPDADGNFVAAYLKVGPCWSLSIVNRSAVVMNVTLISSS